MKESHSFSVAVAKEVGVNGAILLQHLVFLQKSNCPPSGDFTKVWVRRSAKALQTTYPYFSQKELTGALGRLERGGNVESQINNESAYDRAKSYRTTEQGLALVGETAFPKRENDICQKGKSTFAKRENQHLPKGKMSIEGYTGVIHPFGTGVIDAATYENDFKKIKPETLEAGMNGKPSNGAARRETQREALERLLTEAADGPLIFVDVPFEKEAAPDLHGSRPAKTVKTKPHTGAGFTDPAEKVRRLDPKNRAEQFGQFKPFDIEAEFAALKTDPFVRESFTLNSRVPAEKFDEYADLFPVWSRGNAETYNNRKELRQHFQGWARGHWKGEQAAIAKTPTVTTDNLARNATSKTAFFD